MARLPRLELAGVPLHIIQRGVNRSACFFSDIDRRFYLQCLAKYARRRGCAIHAYVLMTNHVHLLVTPPRKGAVAGMVQDIGRTYVRTINSIHARSGTLWNGRFRSSLIDSENYFLTCHRYIELNPVRAGMVRHPAQYPWSSYGHYGEGKENPFLTPHQCYRALALSPEGRVAAFAELMDEPLAPEVVEKIRAAANACAALGSEAFLERAKALVGREVGIPPRGRPRRKDRSK
ncbi:MAG: transposase [Betaproteobacteria bacterium]